MTPSPIWTVDADRTVCHKDGNATLWLLEYFELTWILIDRWAP